MRWARPARRAASSGTLNAQSTPIAAVQTVSGPDVQANLARFEPLVSQAADSGARLVALPENFALMGLRDTDKVAQAEADGAGPVQDWLAAQARRHGIWLVGGSVHLRSPEPARVWNSLLVYDDQGARRARYDKIHLFGLQRQDERFDEAATIKPGSAVQVLETPFARIGLSICYDIRFPELYRAMGAVDLILAPAAFTYRTGQAHWHTLLAARAVENQCYVLAPAQGGRHPGGRVTWGHSIIIDPWGETLAQRAEGEGVVSAVLDRARIAEVRALLPALAHRTL